MEYFSIKGLSGINRNTSPFAMGEGEFVDTQNFISKKVGILTKSGDYLIKNAQITASQNMLGGIDFFENDGTHNHVVAIDGASNAGIYVDVSGTWTSQSQSLTKNNKVRFAYSPVLDVLFAVNYADATRSCTNALAWSTTTNVTSAPKAKLVMDFGQRIHLLNCVVGSTSYPTRSYRSSKQSAGSITWDTTNDWFAWDDNIVGVGKVADFMVVFGTKSVQVLTLGDEKYPISDHGCVSHDSIDSYGGWVFWASTDGYYAWNGKSEQKISLPIQSYWDGISESNKASIQGKVIGDNLYVWIGDLTSPETLNNNVLVYDINQNDWNRFSLGFNVQDLHTYTSSTSKALFAGDDNGNLYQMLTSGGQNGSVFTSSVETDWIYGKSEAEQNLIKNFYEVWGFGSDLSGLKVAYKVDNDKDFKPLGELTGSTDVVNKQLRGYRLKLRLYEISKGNMYDLYQITIGYKPLYQRTEGETK